MFLSMDDVLDPFARNGISQNKGIVLTAYNARFMRIKDRIVWATCVSNDLYISHFRIPSESPYCRDVFYDIVFELYPQSKGDITSTSLRNYGVRVYSNYISFLFNFCYVYFKAGLIIPWLKDKCNPMALSTPAYQRNRGNIIASDIKMWFAASHFKRMNLFSKRIFEETINTSPSHIQKVVINQTRMLQIRTLTERNNKAQIKTDREQRMSARQKEVLADYKAGKKIARSAAMYNTHTGSKINPTSLAKNIVKEMKTARVARQARSARQAKHKR